MKIMQVRLLRDSPTLCKTFKAGTVMNVVSLTLYADNIGICGIPVDAVEFLNLDQHKPGSRRDPIPPGPEWTGPNTLPPWMGPNKTVEVPEFAPAKPVEAVKPPSGGEQPKRAAKPVAAGQLSMFDESAKPNAVPVVKPSLEELDL